MALRPCLVGLRGCSLAAGAVDCIAAFLVALPQGPGTPCGLRLALRRPTKRRRSAGGQLSRAHV